MTIKNLSFVLLMVLSFIWGGCDNEDTSGDSYADIIDGPKFYMGRL